MDRPRRDLTAVFDGHNDALGELQKAGDPPERFLTGLPERQVDLPRARAGGLRPGGESSATTTNFPARRSAMIARVAMALPMNAGSVSATSAGTEKAVMTAALYAVFAIYLGCQR